MRVNLVRLTAAALLLYLAACNSSEAEESDPVAVDYCAECSELGSCEQVVGDALIAPCPEETRAYYQCLTDSACDPDACTGEWDARETCIESPDDGQPPE